jgi:bile acid:Na+ symporter, BASS family
MSINQLINLLTIITLFEMTVAIGLELTVAEIAAIWRNWRLLLRGALANYVLFPAFTVAWLLLFRPHPMAAAGFLIVAVCPGAHYAPPFTQIAKGNLAVATGLMMVLATSSVLLSPALLGVLLPWFSSEDHTLRVDQGHMIATLFGAQLLPLALGMIVRAWRPKLADRLQKPADLASLILNPGTLSLILVVQFHLLAQVRLIGYAGMLVLVLGGLAIGWLMGGPSRDIRKAMAESTILRNSGVALVIASSSFPGTVALPAALVLGLVVSQGALLLALGWGQQGSARDGMAVEASS